MRWLAAATLTLALRALAISNLDVGPNHRLIGSTQIGVRVDPGERLRLSARSYPAAAFLLTVASPGPAAQQLTVQPDAQGWRDDAIAPLLIDVAPGTSALSLSVPGVPQADARFDFSLEVVDSDGVVKPGRVYSGRWEFDSGSYLQQTNADFWVRVPTPSGDAVWQLEMNGLAGWQFQVQANRVGVEPPSSSRSVPMATNWVRAGYDVYLEPPDLPLAQPSPVELGEVAQLADGLRVSSSSAGSLVIDVDLDGDGVAPSSPRERLFAVEVPGGSYDVAMTWLDGLGQPIAPGEYAAWATLATDEVHFTAVDVEYCSPGIRFFQYVDGGARPADMSWDDALIDDGTVIRPWARSVSSGDAATPAVAGLNAHAWGGPLGNAYGPGNQTFIDTWASAQRVSARFTVVTGAAADSLPRRDDPFPGTWVTTRDAGEPDAGDDAAIIELPPPAPVERDAGVSVAPAGDGPPRFTGSGCTHASTAPAFLLVLLLIARRRTALPALLVLATPALAFDSELLGPVRLSSAQATAPVLGPDRTEVTLSAGLAERPVWYGDAPAVGRLLSGSLAASVRLLPSLAIEAGLGLLYAPATGDNPLWNGARASDAALGVRWRLLDAPRAGLAAFARARIPTAASVDFAGGAAGAALGVAGRWSPHERVEAALELGGAALTGRRSNVRAVGGVAVRTISSVWLAAELDALLYLQPRDDVGNPFPLEARAAVRWHGDVLRVGAVLGAGLNHGVGAPEVRVLMTVGVALPFDRLTAPTSTSTRAVRLAEAPSPGADVPSPSTATELLVLVEDDIGAPLDADVRRPGGVCERRAPGRYACRAARGVVDVSAPGRFPLTLGVDGRQLEVRAVLMPEHPAFAVGSATLPLELDLYFDTNDATLSEEGARQLARFVERLQAAPRALVLEIAGHADARGTDGDNMVLSLQRAEAVRQWLRAHGTSVPLVVSARGATEAQPLANDAALAGDRRVHVGVPK